YSYPSGNAWYVDGASAPAEPYQGGPAAPAASAAPPPQGAIRAAPAQNYRYYCPDAGYYPAVTTCAQGWLRVVPGGSPPQ
ncbi:MAG: hypothetical protein ABIR52_07115, partial [Casimicrobiaceae bacterium]